MVLFPHRRNRFRGSFFAPAFFVGPRERTCTELLTVKESFMETGKETKKSKSIILWLLIILAPVIAGWLIGLISGTNPLHLDAWNTTWNDENAAGHDRV